MKSLKKSNRVLLAVAALLTLVMLAGCTGSDTPAKEPNEKPAGTPGTPPPAGPNGASLGNPVAPAGGK